MVKRGPECCVGPKASQLRETAYAALRRDDVSLEQSNAGVVDGTGNRLTEP